MIAISAFFRFPEGVVRAAQPEGGPLIITPPPDSILKIEVVGNTLHVTVTGDRSANEQSLSVLSPVGKNLRFDVVNGFIRAIVAED